MVDLDSVYDGRAMLTAVLETLALLTAVVFSAGCLFIVVQTARQIWCRNRNEPPWT